MFREMRRKSQKLPQAETDAISKTCTSGVLAVEGDDGYPCAVPLSYVYDISEGQREIERDWNKVCAAELVIEHMTGKVGIGLVNDRAASDAAKPQGPSV